MNRGSEADALRVGTAERDLTSRLLADHFAEGRLTTAEYESRVDRALAARVRGDIRELFTDLPAPHPPFLSDTPVPANGLPVPTAAPGTDVQPSEQSDRSAAVAGILQIVLPFGAGRFYTRDTRLAVFQLAVTVLTVGMGALWPIIDGIILLVEGGTDGQGRKLH
ncbi:DUF1707 domain-containing protein [Saccharomonospora sp. NB11]|jgi:hypothetical protein|uniref:DUF1707 domain-containing protein n=1 Tax=Saccharomonospora sp. NB11 TaxID=1642298 RepID=UPI0018D06350|nr:DUF1707 domain-containing protein [Saccharomonospora sp. NB11]